MFFRSSRFIRVDDSLRRKRFFGSLSTDSTSPNTLWVLGSVFNLRLSWWVELVLHNQSQSHVLRWFLSLNPVHRKQEHAQVVQEASQTSIPVAQCQISPAQFDSTASVIKARCLLLFLCCCFFLATVVLTLLSTLCAHCVPRNVLTSASVFEWHTGQVDVDSAHPLLDVAKSKNDYIHVLILNYLLCIDSSIDTTT